MAGRIQGADIKTSTEIVAAGGTIAQLPTDDQSYVTANGINKTLKQAIIDGDISGGQTALTFAKSLITQTGSPMYTSSGGYIQQDGSALIENSLPTALVVTNDATDGVKYTVNKPGVIIINATYANNNSSDWVKIFKNGSEYKGRGVSAIAYSGAFRDDVFSSGFSDIAASGDVYQFKFNTSYLSTLLGAWGSQATLIAGGGANSIYDIQFGSYVTADGTRSSTSYGATTNPISITVTPVANCIYKISCPFNFYGTAGNTNRFVIQNTVGSATLVSQADVIQDATVGYYGTFNEEAIAYYSLSAGVSYTFELWCKSSGGGTITVNNSGTTSGTKMIAEAVGYSVQTPLVGIIKYPANASSSWPTGGSVGSYSGYGTNANAATMIVVNGALSAPDTTVPGFKMDVIAGTKYKITATGQFGQNITGYCKFRFSDGTDSTEQAGIASSLSGSFSDSASILSAIYIPSTSGLKTIEIQASTTAGQSTIYNDGGLDIVFTVERI